MKECEPKDEVLGLPRQVQGKPDPTWGGSANGPRATEPKCRVRLALDLAPSGAHCLGSVGA
jgi:hypothetical protein